MAVCDQKDKGDIGDGRNVHNWVVRLLKENGLVKEVEWKSERGAYVSGVIAGQSANCV